MNSVLEITKGFMSDICTEIKNKQIGLIILWKIKFDGENYRATEYNKVLDLIFQEANKLCGS